MADYQVIRHSADLFLHLIDTVTGGEISGGGIRFFRDGRQIFPLSKGDGNYILMDQERKDFHLRVEAPGYLSRGYDVHYGELEEHLPTLEFHLLPGPRYRAADELLSLEGCLPGLIGLDAVWAGDNSCMIRSFDQKKRAMTVFNPHHLELNKIFYAVVNPDTGIYEALEIKERLSDTQYTISEKLQKEFGSHFPVCRRIFGVVEKDGTYRLCVNGGGGDPKWFVRCVTGDREWFQTIDFDHPQEPPLRPPDPLGEGRAGSETEKGGM